MESESYLEMLGDEFTKIEMERFLSYGEILEKLGFEPDPLSSAYEQGWYKGEFMTLSDYLSDRIEELHGDWKNAWLVYRHDTGEIVTSSDWQDIS